MTPAPTRLSVQPPLETDVPKPTAEKKNEERREQQGDEDDRTT